MVTPPDELGPRQAELVRVFLSHGHATRADLIRLTGWSRAVLGGHLETLVRGGWVEVAERVAAAGLGRPTERLRFRSEAALVEVIECGVVTRMSLLTIEGDIVAEDTISLSVHDPLSAVADACHAVRDSFVIGAGRAVVCTVISVTAAVDEQHRARNSTIHKSWSRDSLATALGTPTAPVVIENDANTTAYGLAAPGETLLAVTVGEGVGSGLVVGGRLQRGRAGEAGEIGHLPVTGAQGRICVCGQVGCLLSMATLPAMCRDAGVPPGSGAARDALEEALTRGSVATTAAVVHAVGTTLGSLLAATVAVVAVERIIISSGSPAVDAALVGGCGDALQKILGGLNAPSVAVSGEAGIRPGALRLATDAFLGNVSVIVPKLPVNEFG